MNRTATSPRSWMPSLAMLLLLLALPWAEAAAQSRTRGRTSSDTTQVRRSPRAEPERTTPERTRRERTTPERTTRERSTPRVPSRTSREVEREVQREAPRSSTREGRGRTSGTRPDDGRTRGQDRGRVERGRDDRYDRRDDRRDDQRYRRGDRYDRRWDQRYHPRTQRHRPGYRPQVYVHVEWPWVQRYHRRWAPRYQYRQVVYVESGWRGGRRDDRLDVRTTYRHRVRHATDYRAEVDVYVDRVEIYQNGRFVGEVDRIPADLGRIRATVYRNGRVRFDRDVFVVGDAYSGFEMISTRHYDGFVFDDYRRDHGYRAGVLDFRRNRVRPVRYSRLFDPYDFNGYVPVSLLPEDTHWLMDYGYQGISDVYYGDDAYYYGGGTYGGTYGDDGYYRDDDYYPTYRREAPDGRVSVLPGVQPRAVSPDGQVAGDVLLQEEALQREEEQSFKTSQGADIRLRREVQIKRIE